RVFHAERKILDLEGILLAVELVLGFALNVRRRWRLKPDERIDGRQATVLETFDGRLIPRFRGLAAGDAALFAEQGTNQVHGNLRRRGSCQPRETFLAVSGNEQKHPTCANAASTKCWRDSRR